MAKYLALALLLVAPFISADSIYRTTDKDGNVVFTDAPPADSGETKSIGLQRTNTAPPPPDRPGLYPRGDGADSAPEEAPYKVNIISPANETSFPMGPGNFTVKASIYPALQKYESLQLFMDGEPHGDPQASVIWDLTNVFRGAHDITVGVLDRGGETLALSGSVRVYVHRPSVNFRNRP